MGLTPATGPTARRRAARCSSVPTPSETRSRETFPATLCKHDTTCQPTAWTALHTHTHTRDVEPSTKKRHFLLKTHNLRTLCAPGLPAIVSTVYWLYDICRGWRDGHELYPAFFLDNKTNYNYARPKLEGNKQKEKSHPGPQNRAPVPQPGTC